MNLVTWSSSRPISAHGGVSLQVFPFCSMLSVTSRLLDDMVSVSAEFAAGARLWVGPSVDPEYSRGAGWAPADILEL